jgi:hypothetical protein
VNTAGSATARWEARFATSGEDRARCSTWKLDALYFAAAREAYDREHAAMMAAAARRRDWLEAEQAPSPQERVTRRKRETAIERHLQRAGF